MNSETSGETGKTEGAAKGGWKCPPSDPHVHRDDVRKVWKECQEESFWYRALPLSLGSMAVAGGFIYKGIWKSSNGFGPFPKLAVAGILGYAVGKASYVGTCQRKFQNMGLDVGPGFKPWSVGRRCGPFTNSSRGHRFCNHVCEECVKTAQAAPAEQKVTALSMTVLGAALCIVYTLACFVGNHKGLTVCTDLSMASFLFSTCNK